MAERDLSDYVEVAERIEHFRKKYPEGCLRPLDPAEPYKFVQAMGWEKNGDQTMQSFVVVVAAAYRTPTDPSPGVGMAWEIFPGRTPYTRGSELQNAETSAWGRAIVAVGASDSKRGIASREEVRNRQAEREDGLPVNADGSLSRSRTTDEQKAAAGVMTSAQQAAHSQLAKRPPNSGKVQRLTESPWQPNPVEAAVDDVWMDGPAGFAPLNDPEDQPGTATTDQIKQIQTLYTAEFGIKDQAERRETTRKFLGLDVLPSHTRLSYRQAGDLLLAMRAKLSEKAAK